MKHLLKDLGLTNRALTALSAEGLTTIEQVIQFHEANLLRWIPGFGSKSLSSLTERLAYLGFRMNPDLDIFGQIQILTEIQKQRSIKP